VAGVSKGAALGTARSQLGYDNAVTGPSGLSALAAGRFENLPLRQNKVVGVVSTPTYGRKIR